MVFRYHTRLACGRPWAQSPVCPFARVTDGTTTQRRSESKNPQSTDHTSQHPKHSHHSEHPTAQLPQHSSHSTTATTTTQEQRNAEQPQHHQAPSSQNGLEGRPSAISSGARPATD